MSIKSENHRQYCRLSLQDSSFQQINLLVTVDDCGRQTPLVDGVLYHYFPPLSVSHNLIGEWYISAVKRLASARKTGRVDNHAAGLHIESQGPKYRGNQLRRWFARIAAM